MKTMKQWLLMGLFALATFSLTACSEDDKNDNDSGNSGNTTESYILITPSEPSIAPFKISLPELNGNAEIVDGQLQFASCQVEGPQTNWHSGFFWVEIFKGENDMAGKWVVQPEFGINYDHNGKHFDLESSRYNMPVAENLSVTDKIVRFSFKGEGTMDDCNADYNYVYNSYGFTYEVFINMNVTSQEGGDK